METATLIIVLVIALALFFDFTNGFHDTANAMATPIATGALKPKTAVLLAAVLNLVGAFLSTEVAQTISGGIINEEQISHDIFPEIILAGLIGAITWNMLTWLLGLPSSSSHALFGGLIGATIVGVGFTAVTGAMNAGRITFDMTTLKSIAMKPTPTIVAPIRPPNRACDELDGSPRSHVSMFHVMAPMRPARMISGKMSWEICSSLMIPPEMV